MSDIFNHGYPYSDYHELNLTWVIEKIQELNKNLDTLEERVKAETLQATKDYVDGRMSEIISEFNALSNEVSQLVVYFDNKVSQLQNQYDTFIISVRNQLNMMSDRIDDFDQTIKNDIIGVNTLTDLKIEQNNEYILNEVAKGVVNVKVVNFFTGERITVQDMFDFLCSLHATDTATVQEFVDAEETVQTLIDMNHTMGDWARYSKQYLGIS